MDQILGVDRINYEQDIFAKVRLIGELAKEKNYKKKDLAKMLNLHPTYLSNLFRLPKLSPIIIDGYYAKHISISHLVVLSRISVAAVQLEVYEKILERGLNVAQTEELVREKLYAVKSRGERIDPGTYDNIKARLKEIFNPAEIKIVQTKIQSTITIKIKGDLASTSEILRKIESL